jgi:NAD(P)-dependent dehydrogenase (short-subunit alcohol dehydrogenase family)
LFNSLSNTRQHLATCWRAYATSKLCNILFTYELSKKLQEKGLSTSDKPITVNAFNPGFMPGTDLGRETKGITRFAWYKILPPLTSLSLFGRTPKKSAEDLAHLILSPELEHTSGKYFDERKIIPSSKESYDKEKAQDLGYH